MGKFEVNKENAPFIVQAFKTNSHNARAIIRSKYPITDADFAQIKSDYLFDGLSRFLPKKKRNPTFYQDKKALKEAGAFIDSTNKSVSYPHDEISPEHEVFVKNLMSIGFTIQHTTF